MNKDAQRTKELMLSEFKELHSMSWESAREVLEVYLDAKLKGAFSQPIMSHEYQLIHSIRKERLGL